MDKYGELGDSLYCYSGTSILKNKLNIRDEHILEQAELELSGLSSSLIDYAEPPYNLQYLQAIHTQLFGDLYEWAGQLRQIDISKGDTRFCTFSRIGIETNKLLNSLQQQNYFQDLESKYFIPKLADLYCELNVIHPFREGNGRTQRIFFEHLIAYCGYGIDWSKINSKEQWVQANIEGFYGNLQLLIQIFESCLTLPD
ncbi:MULTISPECIES: putative adenosine monophosphate-protein transferase Fic [unclassified Acinetobacter]|uniref:putative adenosine monophosphate-protein transferase Fic n=1 Tax=unclassified Acinetobacter TaxID=196816 RepID=UPI002812F7BA|nr:MULTISPECIES: putative adenosine monophosphate-protein transferase Fic [unclassified Acinetobacter]MDQ9949820.1 putative adenosine monophosphate-protein transferase Fic [Acinetobacter sp. 12966]MEB3795902.1 putative adenosine monophosphate-protein transferase Fic [Acinetobacter sp. IK24]MEB3815113.1 putative adenosine monophosphate-protein transferase Fic [Acinetobacter sp. IK22]MEB3834159.1 putative adenosine monophosphate-protein transferase Fic [Acinetobacter sp. IK23]MEB3837935.1 putati